MLPDQKQPNRGSMTIDNTGEHVALIRVAPFLNRRTNGKVESLHDFLLAPFFLFLELARSRRAAILALSVKNCQE